jgi:hypothetical protein
MNREERRIYQLGVAFAAVMIIAMTSVLTEECGKNTVYAAAEVVDGNFIDGTATSPEKGQIREDSAMPCVDAESFRRFLETYEPETTEEARTDAVRPDHEDVRTEEITLAAETETAVEAAVPTLYRIAGEEIDESIQVRLYQYLQEAGIPYWYEGALCQMFQESHGQQYAVNQTNHEDMGLFQYKNRFWNWADGDIFDVDAQMSRYASDMAARFNSGLTVDEAISRHNTSDSVAAVNWEYVGQVKQWLGKMEVIE